MVWYASADPNRPAAEHRHRIDNISTGQTSESAGHDHQYRLTPGGTGLAEMGNNTHSHTVSDGVIGYASADPNRPAAEHRHQIRNNEE